MNIREANVARIDWLNTKIKELSVKIAEHERAENKRNYKFYVTGTGLYRSLALLKVERRIARNIIKKEDGE